MNRRGFLKALAGLGTLALVPALPVINATKRAYAWVSVKLFGAIGDGLHDDAAAIQRAIDYAVLNDIPEVRIPAGTYFLSDWIEHPYWKGKVTGEKP